MLGGALRTLTTASICLCRCVGPGCTSVCLFPKRRQGQENITAGCRAAAAHRWLNGKSAPRSSMWAREHGAATHRRGVGGEDLWAAASKNKTSRPTGVAKPRQHIFS